MMIQRNLQFQDAGKFIYIGLRRIFSALQSCILVCSMKVPFKRTALEGTPDRETQLWVAEHRSCMERNFFDAIVTPIACFGAGPRWIRIADMEKLDVHFRRTIRCVVGAPGGICWQDPWHEIQHIWSQRVREQVEVCHMKTRAETCASQQWNLACYIMSIPCERWARRMLHRQPIGRGPVGRPAMNWTSKYEQFSRIKRWDDWF